MSVTDIDIVKANFDRRHEIQGELRQIDEAATTDKRDYSDDEKNRILELRAECDPIDGRIRHRLEAMKATEEQRGGIEHILGLALDRHDQVQDVRSIGERFTGAEGFEDWSKHGARGSFNVPLEGLDIRSVTDTTLGSTSGGAFVVPTMLPRVGQKFLDRKVFLTDLLDSIPVPSASVEFVQDVSPLADLADKAAETSEDSAKPQAGFTSSLVTTPVATIPAWVNITRQVAQDVPQIQAYLNGRLRYALKRRFDKQAINGDGSSPNLKGLINQSNIVTNAPGSSEARYITIRHTIKLMNDNEAEPELIVLNPADSEYFDLANSAANGIHAVPNANDGPAKMAWGMQIVTSTAVASGTAVLLDPTCVALLDRMEPTAFLTDSHASNFTANILTLLLELRAGLALFNPSGVGVATFNGSI